jgi:hypothetical protein
VVRWHRQSRDRLWQRQWHRPPAHNPLAAVVPCRSQPPAPSLPLPRLGYPVAPIPPATQTPPAARPGPRRRGSPAPPPGLTALRSATPPVRRGPLRAGGRRRGRPGGRPGGRRKRVRQCTIEFYYMLLNSKMLSCDVTEWGLGSAPGSAGTCRRAVEAMALPGHNCSQALLRTQQDRRASRPPHLHSHQHQLTKRRRQHPRKQRALGAQGRRLQGPSGKGTSGRGVEAHRQLSRWHAATTCIPGATPSPFPVWGLAAQARLPSHATPTCSSSWRAASGPVRAWYKSKASGPHTSAAASSSSLST